MSRTAPVVRTTSTGRSGRRGRGRFEDSPLGAYVLSVVRGRQRSPAAEATRVALAGLSLGYAGMTRTVQASFQSGIRRCWRLPAPVISVGSLALGGTGKTPLTRWIARFLTGHGLRVGILLRGHGGRLVQHGGIVSTGRGPRLDATLAGDEAVMHAVSLPGVAVAVGRDRVAMGRRLLRAASCDVLVLDDGFQYWRLHRDLDLALVLANDPFGNGRPLPRGLLREPPARIQRADFLVITHAERTDADALESLTARLRRYGRPGTEVATCRLELSQVTDLEAGEAATFDELRSQPILLVSALANNEQFAETARSLGVNVAGHLRLPDHHAYDHHTVETAVREARRLGAGALLTTEKDSVKLRRGRLGMPAFALHVDVTLDPQEAFETRLLDVVRTALSGPGPKSLRRVAPCGRRQPNR